VWKLIKAGDINGKVEGNKSGKKETTNRYKFEQLGEMFYLIARKKRTQQTA
jgi:hypothetical protein